ncbi:hypothetical protein [Asticcacaulis sp. YBE204]|uniref:hypothetical protein n=1 Tax=Asticcacaulis sp. YBE204 TaxID=1282363 RepID=UPI0003C3BF53|nr:hypothetical protein [Asticcacaulis sp. YBE204]ESQ81259.1 hypothetical protein AEYBE204_02670 [Asticcacaulis sp. YBE204]
MNRLKTLALNAVALCALAGAADAQTPVVPLTALEATQCRAIAETLRDREYEQMSSLITRIERSPNLSVEALNAVQKQISTNETSIKTLEGHADRFAFAAQPNDTLKALVVKQDTEALKLKLSDCLERVPPVVPSKPAMAKN